MELFRIIMLLLVQLSPIFFHVYGAALSDYECKGIKSSTTETVNTASAKLTNGCVMNSGGITFDLKTMYEAAARKNPKPTSVVIDISEAIFSNSYINLIKANGIPNDLTTQAIPLLFTMMNSKMSGNSMLEFGHKGAIFKLPPHSLLRILHSELTVAIDENDRGIFTFYSLQLITGSSFEIANNAITMNFKNSPSMVVFNIAEYTAMILLGSSFNIVDNKIKMNGEGNVEKQFIWRTANAAQMTVSESSIFTFAGNIINLVGNNVITHFEQSVMENRPNTHITIKTNSICKLTSNNISMVTSGKDVSKRTYQSVWYQDNSPLTLSNNSQYIFTLNNIDLEVHNVAFMHQVIWEVLSAVTITVNSQFLFESNRILMLGWDYKTVGQSHFSVMSATAKNIKAISSNSIVILRKNCVVMWQEKGYIFMGKWTITGTSELLWDGNYFTTTDEYIPADGKGLTEFVWGPKSDTAMTITTGSKLTIKNTQVHGNNGTSGATYSTLWNSSLATYYSYVVQPPMVWSASPAEDAGGNLIPRMDKTNLRQYMCVGLPNIPAQKVTPTITPTGSFTPSPTESLTPSPTGSLTTSPTGSFTPNPTGSLTPSPTGSLTPNPTGSLTPNPTGSLTPTITISVALTPTNISINQTYPSINQCFDVTNASQPLFVTVDHLFTNGVVFEFTVSRPLVSDDDVQMVVVEALLWGVENAVASLLAKCHTTVQSRYTCKFPPPPASLPSENVSGIYIRYIPSPSTSCPLGFAMVVHPQMRLASNISGASAPVCPVMTNALTDGSVFVIVARSPCAPKESQQGAKVAMHLIAPFSDFGPSAAVFGNIDLTVFLCVVGFAILYLGKHSGLDIFTEHPILKYKVGFRAIMLGMWFWLAELTYPGVVVGTFGLIRAGDDNYIGLGTVGCVYLVVVPVMAMVVMGPLRSLLVTYEEVNVGYLGLGYGMCHSQFTPHGMWGGTGPALGPLTQPFAGTRKAAVCAPLPYIVMVVVGAVLHAAGPGTSCVARLATVVVLLFVVGVAIAVTRPFRYNINNVLYTVTLNLLALYTALLAVTASRHDVRHNSQEYSSDIAMGFAQLMIGVSLCLVFLVRGGVFVVIVIKG